MIPVYSVRDVPGPYRAVVPPPPPPPLFFVSVDSKILRVSVSHSFSTLTRQITSVDSKGFAWAESDPPPTDKKLGPIGLASKYERILYWKNYQGVKKKSEFMGKG